MVKKLNLSNEKLVREKVMAGVDKMADLVSLTLGPCGRSVMMERGQDPFIVDDGRRVAENILLDDPVEQAASKIAYGVTQKTDEEAGDGTTTATVLTRALLKDIHETKLVTGIGTSINVAEIDQQIQDAREEVTKLIEKEVKPIKTEKDLIDVSTVIAGPEIGELVAKMYWKLGKDGHISIEMNPLSEEIETEVTQGYRLPGGYAANWMVNNLITKTWVCEKVDVLVTEQEVNDQDQIVPVANALAQKGKNLLVIVAKDFSPTVILSAYQNATRKESPFFLILVKSRNQEIYKDVAVFSGAKFFNVNEPLESAKVSDLGYLRSIEVGKENTFLVDGRGKKEDIDAYVKELQSEAKGLKLEGYRQPIYERISLLTGGVGVIRIGAPTEEARTWLKYKVEDAKYGTKYAFKEGVIPGGGMTFKKISEALPESNILKKALLAPHETLKANAGGKLVVGKNIFDSVVSQKSALKYACSAVSKLIRIGGAIVHLPIPTMDEAMRQFKKD